MTSYNEQIYSHIEDNRSQVQKQQQHSLMESIYQRNLQHLIIPLTQRKKVSYKARQRIKIQFGEQWYCYITDNNLEFDDIILTIHGAPGDHQEWAGLEFEMQQSCRWINLIVPGFDGEDERRGTYNGTAEHFSKLIIKLINKLKVYRIIFCGHSLGSIYGTYFIKNYPERIKGYINITGIINYWYTGLLVFFNLIIAQPNYNNLNWRKSQLINNNKYRKQIHKQFLERISQITFGPVNFPKLNQFQMCAYIKLINSFPNGISQLFQINAQLNILQMLIFGKKDPLHNPYLTEATILQKCSKFQCKEPKVYFIQTQIMQKFGLKINADKLQQYFCYHFDDTGHNAHKRRPKEISRIITIYLTCLNIIQRYQILSKTTF